jgi:hypothetical protein
MRNTIQPSKFDPTSSVLLKTLLKSYDVSQDLARRLQAEEDAHAREMYRRGKELQAQRSRERSERHRLQDEVQQLYNTNPDQHNQQPSGSSAGKPPKAPKMKKKNSCIIM